ncbi:hypothetical protein ANCCAN_09336 [Ancylostoma caninum]|uniref:PPPDE domain-containing protein n=1 Tax=Ancylostoma caninum TaxID=29170 RepID=A0A368GJX2_ANCCA|nr:hypothetical protein ANCCAN_09336 [Ancylostoma caninum]
MELETFSEYAYGGHPYAFSGVFENSPQDAEELGENFKFKQSIVIGETAITAAGVRELIKSLGQEYRGDRYHLISRNCNHFSAVLAKALTGNDIPTWINRLANLSGSIPFLERCLPQEWLTPVALQQSLEDQRNAEGSRQNGAEAQKRLSIDSAEDALDARLNEITKLCRNWIILWSVVGSSLTLVLLWYLPEDSRALRAHHPHHPEQIVDPAHLRPSNGYGLRSSPQWQEIFDLKQDGISFLKLLLTCQFERVISSDENAFNMDDLDRCRHYWRDLWKEPLMFSRRIIGGGSLMAWAAFRSSEKLELALVSRKKDSAEYQEVLGTHLLLFREVFGAFLSFFSETTLPSTSLIQREVAPGALRICSGLACVFVRL